MTRPAPFVLALAFLGALALACASSAAAPAAPEFADAFWKHWGDGRAELAGYDLVTPRYGASRTGTAVAIFVTETFSNALRVKADPGKHPRSDEFPVMKLNLVQDFSTGVYDYNLQTSAFVALAPANGRPAGAPTKVSFSSQEWCGNVYAQLLFDKGSARLASHSYFDGEADRSEALPCPADAVAEDALLVWARGLAWPRLSAGESATLPLARSLRESRLRAPARCNGTRAVRARGGAGSRDRSRRHLRSGRRDRRGRGRSHVDVLDRARRAASRAAVGDERRREGAVAGERPAGLLAAERPRRRSRAREAGPGAARDADAVRQQGARTSTSARYAGRHLTTTPRAASVRVGVTSRSR